MICCIIPTYKALNTICAVVDHATRYVDLVIVVDDQCPQRSGALVEKEFHNNESVLVISHSRNQGVGGAVKTGIAKALELGASVIIKIDADNQMDPRYIPVITNLFAADGGLEYVKGNRFIDLKLIGAMPRLRLIGNSGLSLLVKFSSGYWNILDPTNGYIAFSSRALQRIQWQELSPRYFFETHVLCVMGLKKARIAEIDMPARYGDEESSLSMPKSLLEFPPKLFKLWLKRMLLQYFVFDINLGSLYLLFGLILTASAALFGVYEWVASIVTKTPRTTGTVMLAVLPFLMGFQLLLNALMHDVQFSAKSTRVSVEIKDGLTE